MTTTPVPSDSHARFEVLYRIARKGTESIQKLAQDLTIEQTVETPAECLNDTILSARIVGEVTAISPCNDIADAFNVTVSYRSDITGYAIPQLLNVLFGNSSIKDNISIRDILFDTTLHQTFTGPGFGVTGLREMLGIYGRPLSCTATKPMGLTVAELASLAERFARGGADIIKDDHGLSDQHFHPFRDRVAACQEAVTRANASTGGSTLYFPMISGRFDQLEDQVRYAVTQGVRGILVAPMLVGPDTVRYLAETYRLVILGHPALTGAFYHHPRHGMTQSVLLGTIFRMIGCDVSIFPHAGGRFSFTEKQCRDLATALRRPEGSWKAAFPCPAGGMSIDRVKEMVTLYGVDTMLLIGGAILKHPRGVEEGTRVFMDRIKSHFPDHQKQSPHVPAPTACEIPSNRTSAPPARYLRHQGYTWSGRRATPYKSEDPCSFRGISRQELTGPFGEKTSFDVRYFEIEPGGFSSKERHVHEHIIIGVRGSGKLCLGDETIQIRLHDVARVAAMQPHQLRNESQEPFGFFCIVDHHRDRPIPVD